MCTKLKVVKNKWVTAVVVVKITEHELFTATIPYLSTMWKRFMERKRSNNCLKLCKKYPFK